LRIVSTFEKAKEAVEEYCLMMEQDVFVCETKYPSGVEYSLRLRDEVTFQDSPAIKYAYFMPISWHFKERKNAYRESQVWANRTGMPIFIEEHTRYVKGYREITHYTLTDKFPQDV